MFIEHKIGDSIIRCIEVRGTIYKMDCVIRAQFADDECYCCKMFTVDDMINPVSWLIGNDKTPDIDSIISFLKELYHRQYSSI